MHKTTTEVLFIMTKILKIDFCIKALQWLVYSNM